MRSAHILLARNGTIARVKCSVLRTTSVRRCRGKVDVLAHFLSRSGAAPLSVPADHSNLQGRVERGRSDGICINSKRDLGYLSSFPVSCLYVINLNASALLLHKDRAILRRLSTRLEGDLSAK